MIEDNKIDLQKQGEEAKELLKQVQALESKPKPDEGLREEIKWWVASFGSEVMARVQEGKLEDLPKLTDAATAQILTKVEAHYQAELSELRKQFVGYSESVPKLLSEQAEGIHAQLDPDQSLPGIYPIPDDVSNVYRRGFEDSYTITSQNFLKDGWVKRKK